MATRCCLSSVVGALMGLAVSAASIAADWTVTNDFDTLFVPGSLRSVIVAANLNPGPDIIRFAIPGGPATITLTSGELAQGGENRQKTLALAGAFLGGFTCPSVVSDHLFSDVSQSVFLCLLALRRPTCAKCDRLVSCEC